jgi:hypothetical protein
MKDYQNS